MPGRTVVLLSAILALILGITAWRLQGPQPGDFARAAFIELQQMNPEGVSHAVESPANRVVRDRIIDRFRELGYAPVIHRGYACGQRGKRCANVENIVVLPDEQGDVVLGVAHYDSVPTGPGASDDGAGVAVMLECARRLRGKRFRNPIGFLLTDGEEAGLLGAEAFVRDPASSRVRAVVNVENRGTDGPSFLFETSPNNRDLVPLLNNLSRPLTSSLFYTVYQLLPNDTDVTVFKGAGKIAVNFAAIGGVEQYHQRTDDLAHVNLHTLQHHGENALEMLGALASSDLRAMRPGNAVFFDVLGTFVVWWPEQWTIWIALASLLILIASMRGQSAREITLAALMVLVAIACAAVIGIIAMKSMPRRLAHPAPVIAAMWIAGIGCALLLTRRRSWQGRALIWHAGATALALTLPGVSYLFLVPSVAIALTAHVPPAREWIAASAAAILFFPLGLILYTALGALALPATAVLMAIFASTIPP